MGEYNELVATDIKKAVKITELKKPLNYESVPIEIDENLAFWADSFNKELDDKKWSIDYLQKHYQDFILSLLKINLQ